MEANVNIAKFSRSLYEKRATCYEAVNQDALVCIMDLFLGKS
jgi:hypothetical protein